MLQLLLVPLSAGFEPLQAYGAHVLSVEQNKSTKLCCANERLQTLDSLKQVYNTVLPQYHKQPQDSDLCIGAGICYARTPMAA